MPSTLTSEKKLERFLTDLARRHDVSASSQNQALNAILFFYREVLGQTVGNVNALRAKRPVHARHAPTLADTQLLLQTIRNVGDYRSLSSRVWLVFFQPKNRVGLFGREQAKMECSNNRR